MPNLIEYLIQSDLHSAWEDVEKTLSNSAPPGADIAAIVENIKVLINDVNAPCWSSCAHYSGGHPLCYGVQFRGDGVQLPFACSSINMLQKLKWPLCAVVLCP